MYFMTFRRRGVRATLPHVLLTLLLLGGISGSSWAQASAPADSIHRIALSVGRSLPITTTNPVLKVAVANPDIATVVVVTGGAVVGVVPTGPIDGGAVVAGVPDATFGGPPTVFVPGSAGWFGFTTFGDWTVAAGPPSTYTGSPFFTSVCQ